MKNEAILAASSVEKKRHNSGYAEIMAYTFASLICTVSSLYLKLFLHVIANNVRIHWHTLEAHK